MTDTITSERIGKLKEWLFTHKTKLIAWGHIQYYDDVQSLLSEVEQLRKENKELSARDKMLLEKYSGWAERVQEAENNLEQERAARVKCLIRIAEDEAIMERARPLIEAVLHVDPMSLGAVIASDSRVDAILRAALDFHNQEAKSETKVGSDNDIIGRIDRKGAKR